MSGDWMFAMGIMRITLAVILVVLGLMFALFYLFEAIGIYRLSRNRGYKRAWLAFVPLVNGYVLGGVADNINMCYGRRSSFRIWLLITRVLSGAGMLISLVYMALNLEPMMQEAIFHENDLSVLMSGAYMRYMALTGLGGLLGLANLIVQALVLYRVYQDYRTNAMVYLVLSLLLPFFTGVQIHSFFLFSLRNKPSASLAYRAGVSQTSPYTPYAPYPPQ